MLSIHKLTKSFNDINVLDQVSFNVNVGEVVALIGPNGAGKTTLLRIVAGKLAADEGQIDVQTKQVGYLPQQPEFGDATIAQVLAGHSPHKIGKALSVTGLSGIAFDSHAKRLSGGQKTRLGLARLLLVEPELLLLDEPTNNLDLAGLRWLEQFINHFRGAILLTSHDRAFLNASANVVVALDQGKAMLYGGNYDFYKKQKILEDEAVVD
ncbi:ABC-F family ATP-binding cassette domain-containing protein, partial [Candidatus Microgenomates bacterium]|nr:ABC-F family ATP-binding cassette domain-containing protein [Candidatus Microgenomates bacterium]